MKRSGMNFGWGRRTPPPDALRASTSPLRGEVNYSLNTRNGARSDSAPAGSSTGASPRFS